MSVTLAEIIAQKRVLDKKVKELKIILQRDQTDVLTEELITLLEQRQSKLLSIEAANNTSTIRLGGTEVKISAAIQLRKTIKEKIDFLTSLINNDNCRLSKLDLQRQRDKYYEEYIILTVGITRNDLEVTIG
jgi:hypothetical protein